MKQRILITGGAGFVGRVLTKSLADEHDVTVLDNLAVGEDRLSDQLLSRIRLERADIRDEAAVRKAFQAFDPTVVVHLAAIHYIPLCEREPGMAVHTNVVGTTNLLSACPPGSRFVFASSGAVYSPSDKLHDEEASELGPRDVYGYTKLHGEHLVKYFADARKFSAVNVRLFNVIGPGETNPHLLPEIVAQLKAGYKRLKLGNLWPKRDYIDVRDAAAGFAAAATSGHVIAGDVATINLGTSKQYSVEEIIGNIEAVSGRLIPVDQDPSRIRAVDRPYLGASIKRIKERFSWVPRFKIEESVRALWDEPDFSREFRECYGLT